MRKFVLPVSLLFLLTNAFARSVPQFTIAGKIIDSVTNNTLGFATITLSNDIKNINRSVLSDDAGVFRFNSTLAGHYHISVSDVGYLSRNIKLNVAANIDTLIIKLAPFKTQLKNININARRKIIKQEIDRLSYDIQADPDSKALTVLEMFRKVPLVSVDGNDNIELQGSSSYRIFINGKPSPLMVNNAKDILRQCLQAL